MFRCLMESRLRSQKGKKNVCDLIRRREGLEFWIYFVEGTVAKLSLPLPIMALMKDQAKLSFGHL